MTFSFSESFQNPKVGWGVFILLSILLSAWVASLFVVNDNDKEIHQAAVEFFLQGQSP